MADNVSGIPPVFLRDALDEPAPPDPPEAEPERDDDDGHHHHHLPPLILYRNGGVETNGIEATLLVGWFHVASFVTIGLGIWAAWTWFGAIANGMVGLMWLAMSLALSVLCISIFVAGVMKVVTWWKRRRATTRSVTAPETQP